jgi:hypothetical protein
VLTWRQSNTGWLKGMKRQSSVVVRQTVFVLLSMAQPLQQSTCVYCTLTEQALGCSWSHQLFPITAAAAAATGAAHVQVVSATLLPS